MSSSTSSADRAPSGDVHTPDHIPEFSALRGLWDEPTGYARDARAVPDVDDEGYLTLRSWLDGDVESDTHFTGRVRPYTSRRDEDRRSLALEFESEQGDPFVLYIEQHKGSTYLRVGPVRRTLGNGHDAWTDLFTPESPRRPTRPVYDPGTGEAVRHVEV